MISEEDLDFILDNKFTLMIHKSDFIIMTNLNYKRRHEKINFSIYKVDIDNRIPVGHCKIFPSSGKIIKYETALKLIKMKNFS